MADTLIESIRIWFEGKQRKVVANFVQCSDVFGILTTGYGKSSCYACLPESSPSKKQIQNILWSWPSTKVRLHLTTIALPPINPDHREMLHLSGPDYYRFFF